MYFIKNYISRFIIAVGILMISSCKSTKTVGTGNANLGLSAKQLIKENAKQEAVFKTLQSKLKITYSEGEKEQTHTVSFRMKKDEVIWISATFAIIRAKVTPERVAFYNKLDKTYFEGDYKYLSELLGTELDFEKVQNLLLGEALFNLEGASYRSSIHEGEYVLEPKKQRELFEIFYLLDPSHYKISSQQLSQTKELRHLQVDYKLYQEVDSQKVPELIKVMAVEGNDQTTINLELKSVSLNDDLRFPFNIPSGFEEIKL